MLELRNGLTTDVGVAQWPHDRYWGCAKVSRQMLGLREGLIKGEGIVGGCVRVLSRAVCTAGLIG